MIQVTASFPQFNDHQSYNNFREEKKSLRNTNIELLDRLKQIWECYKKINPTFQAIDQFNGDRMPFSLNSTTCDDTLTTNTVNNCATLSTASTSSTVTTVNTSINCTSEEVNVCKRN